MKRRRRNLIFWRNSLDGPQGAKITIWSHFESEYVLGRKIVFMCKAEENLVQCMSGRKARCPSKARWRSTQPLRMDAGYYECQADNKYAVDVKGFSADYSIEFV
ncbi:putative immunoglobulin-like 2 [Homarus americanus]|uniref:Putative immunoglobulin-like 2 n=1 Tax=Homarus americanus TaxID=6706 RepID=A0A8J5JEM5_HOMAM|nr:putative immunoglobulin-like 2 [Homarus americanus]